MQVVSSPVSRIVQIRFTSGEDLLLGLRQGVAEAGVSVNGWQVLDYDGDVLATSVPAPGLPLLLVAGVLLLFATMHIARGIGRVHGLFAKHLLVKTAQYD